MTNISREQLIAFAANELTGPEADEVAAHLAAHPDAARTVGLYRTAALATAEDDTVGAPAELVARARSIFRAEAPARRGLAEHLQDVIAHLVYDSRLQPAANRAATSAELIQLSFETEDCEIDLRAEPIAPAASGDPAAPTRWRVIGQILSEKATGAVSVNVLTADGADVTEATSDDRGLFRLELPAGRYDLHIGIGDDTIALHGVDIG